MRQVVECRIPEYNVVLSVDHFLVDVLGSIVRLVLNIAGHTEFGKIRWLIIQTNLNRKDY